MVLRRRPATGKNRGRAPRADAPPRIIGGKMSGRKLAYSGDSRTRPMKDRTREALFNLLGPAVKGMHAIDLFAGTGALGFEALSRGASRATLIERHFPTATLIRQSAASLEVEAITEVLATDTFHWAQQVAKGDTTPWVVFCSPPYDFYVDRLPEMLSLVGMMLDAAPPGSLLAVEADTRFDPAGLPRADEWDVRHYPPAVVAVLQV